MSQTRTPRLTGPTTPTPKTPKKGKKKTPKKRTPKRTAKKPPAKEVPHFRVVDRASLWVACCLVFLFSAPLVLLAPSPDAGMFVWAAGVVFLVGCFAPKEVG